MTRTKKILAIFLSAGFAAYCLLCPATVAGAAKIGINRCISSVIPSLYAMMIASGLLIKSGALSHAGRFLNPAARLFFGINGECLAIFLFSMTAGYPVGARLISAIHAEGRLTKRQAELLSGVCFGSGTAFIFACISPNPKVGRLILLSAAGSNALLLALLSVYFRRRRIGENAQKKSPVSAEMLTDCVSSAGRTMGELCFIVTAFAVISGIFTSLLPLPESVRAVVSAVLDVTALAETSLYLPLTAALVSFGGVCVMLQISAIFRGKLSILPLLLLRLTAAAVSFVICRLLMPVVLAGETVSAGATIGELHKAASPVPSVLLIIMTLIVICESTSPASAQS